jgi:hypothetical protein
MAKVYARLYLVLKVENVNSFNQSRMPSSLLLEIATTEKNIATLGLQFCGTILAQSSYYWQPLWIHG